MISKSIYILILIFILSFLSISCYRGTMEPERDNLLVGTWQWEQSCGGILFKCYTPDSVDYTQQLVFTEQHTMKHIRNGEILEVQNYEIEFRRVDMFDLDSAMIIKFERFDEIMVDILNDERMSLVDLHVDGFGHFYTKVE